MKILHIHASMIGGGIESMVCGLANEMANQGHDVTVCSIYEPKSEHVFWHKLNDKVKKESLGKTGRGFAMKDFTSIYKYIKNGGFDAVNMHGFFYYYMLPVMFLHRRVKFFYTVHSDAFEENQLWDQKVLRVKKLAFRRKWLTPITISDASQSSFQRLYNTSSELVYNGVPKPIVKEQSTDVIEQVRITPDTKVLFHAGRIDKVKNQFVLCSASKRLIKEGYDISLVIAGSNQYPDVYAKILPFFCDRIQYIGQRNDIPQLMSESDAMCLSSVYEGLPVTLLEALSVGCVPICTPVGGIVNVVKDAQNGFLSASSNEDDYYLALKRYLDSTPEEITNIKKNVIESFEKYNIVNTARQYVEVYKSK